MYKSQNNNITVNSKQYAQFRYGKRFKKCIYSKRNLDINLVNASSIIGYQKSLKTKTNANIIPTPLKMRLYPLPVNLLM